MSYDKSLYLFVHHYFEFQEDGTFDSEIARWPDKYGGGWEYKTRRRGVLRSDLWELKQGMAFTSLSVRTCYAFHDRKMDITIANRDPLKIGADENDSASQPNVIDYDNNRIEFFHKWVSIEDVEHEMKLDISSSLNKLNEVNTRVKDIHGLNTQHEECIKSTNELRGELSQLRKEVGELRTELYELRKYTSYGQHRYS